MYWADVVAERIVKTRGEKEKYVVASGITPSGYVHVGNFREVFTTWIVGNALEDSGYNVYFFFFWDDYDRFRKVPAGVPGEFEKYIGMPVSSVPDPWGCHGNYAEHFENTFEEELKALGIFPEFLYATEIYKKGTFGEVIKTALENKEKIRGILNMVREKAKEDPLPENWWPVSVYCEKCGKDSTKVTGYDGRVAYQCACGHSGKVEPGSGFVKLKWRVDWPARWFYYRVDFEPAGKDHHAAGGSYETGARIAKEVYNAEPPYSIMYEFVSVKGAKGKMSGSKGNVILLSDFFEVMEKGLIRFYYARYRPSKEIKVDLGADLLKQYDEYDREEKEGDLERAFELCKGEKSPGVSFSTLVYLVQIPGMTDEKLLNALKRMGKKFDEEKVLERSKLARNWVKKYAPEEFTIKVPESPPEVPKHLKQALNELASFLEENPSEEELQKELYEIPKKHGINIREFFQIIYLLLLGKKGGPRAAGLLLAFDRDFAVKRLRGEA